MLAERIKIWQRFVSLIQLSWKRGLQWAVCDFRLLLPHWHHGGCTRLCAGLLESDGQTAGCTQLRPLHVDRGASQHARKSSMGLCTIIMYSSQTSHIHGHIQVHTICKSIILACILYPFVSLSAIIFFSFLYVSPLNFFLYFSWWKEILN